MKIFAFFLVFFSAFCAAFARYDISNAERRSRTALLRSSTGNRIVAVSRNLKTADTRQAATTPLEDTDDDEDTDTDEDDDDKVSLLDTDTDDDDDKVSLLDTDDDTDDDDEVSLPDTESDFNSDIESIDGQSDDDCPTGQYTLKYIRKERFSWGKKSKRVKAKNLRSCGKKCAKQTGGKCSTFNWKKNKKQCQMFSTKSIGRKKVKDNRAVAAYLQCIE